MNVHRLEQNVDTLWSCNEACVLTSNHLCLSACSAESLFLWAGWATRAIGTLHTDCTTPWTPHTDLPPAATLPPNRYVNMATCGHHVRMYPEPNNYDTPSCHSHTAPSFTPPLLYRSTHPQPSLWVPDQKTVNEVLCILRHSRKLVLIVIITNGHILTRLCISVTQKRGNPTQPAWEYKARLFKYVTAADDINSYQWSILSVHMDYCTVQTEFESALQAHFLFRHRVRSRSFTEGS